MHVLTSLEKCARMRAAKEAKRMAAGSAPDVRELGRVEFDGVLFGGKHTVRLLALSDRPTVDIEVDGRVTCCKTPRGARALLMRRLAHPRIGLEA